MAHKNRSNWSPYKARKAAKAADPNQKAAKAADPNQKAAKAALPNQKTAESFGKANHKRPVEIYELDEAEDRLRDLFQHHGLGWFPNGQRRKILPHAHGKSERAELHQASDFAGCRHQALRR